MWYNPPSFESSKILRQKGSSRFSLEIPPMKLKSAWTKDAEKTREGDLLSVIEHTAAIHSIDNPAHLIEFGLDAICAVTGAHAASVFLWNETSKELTLSSGRGPYLEKISRARIRLKEGIAGWVADTGKSVLVRDVQKDYRFYALKRFNDYHSHSFISIPLVASDNKLIGVLNLTEQKDLSPFNDDDLECANAVAKHMALAYERLKIQRRLKKENSDLNQANQSLKESLNQQESFVSIGKLASNLAHELNNPLDAIRRFINLALDQVMEDSLAREYLLKGKQGVRRAIQVIRGLLSFSRETKAAGSRLTELHVTIDQIVAEMTQSSNYTGLSFQLEFCEGPVQVYDCGLKAMFRNLFDNAHHAMKGNGQVTVSTYRNGACVTVSIRDAGCGIPEQMKERVFEPFFTTKEDGCGTGIGLAICRDIVERSGGKITFTSEAENGATFFVTLPLAS